MVRAPHGLDVLAVADSTYCLFTPLHRIASMSALSRKNRRAKQKAERLKLFEV